MFRRTNLAQYELCLGATELYVPSACLFSGIIEVSSPPEAKVGDALSEYLDSTRQNLVFACWLKVLCLVFTLIVVGCSEHSQRLPTDGKAPPFAYQLGLEITSEIANRKVPLRDHPRLLPKAKWSDLRPAFSEIYDEVGDLVSMEMTVCNDVMPLEGKEYPIRVRCWTTINNECKKSRIVVVVASTEGRWDDPSWGLLAFGMQRSIIEQSLC